MGVSGLCNRKRNKSLFASFSSEKEDSSFSEEKEAKRLLFYRSFGFRVGVRRCVRAAGG
jgi:hypothetical protein